MTDMKKSHFYTLLIVFSVITILLGILTFNHRYQLNKQIATNKHRLAMTELLEERITNLKSELKSSYVDNDALINLHSENGRIEKAKPMLAEWIYKHSKISRSMVNEILDNVTKSSSPLFLLALIKAESNFNPTAISSKGAMGLGQIMPLHEETLIKAGVLKEMRDVFNISIAIKATEFVWEMKMLRANGDISKALSMYLGGDSHRYVNQILKDYFQLNYLCKKPMAHKEIDVKREHLKNSDNVYKKEELQNDKFIYIVKSGDTLSKIAKNVYGEIDKNILNSIVNNNPGIKDAGSIQIGQEIVLTGVYIRGNYRSPNL